MKIPLLVSLLLIPACLGAPLRLEDPEDAAAVKSALGLGDISLASQGPYASVSAALAAGVAPDAMFRHTDGTLRKARPIIQRLAILGDSQVVGGAGRSGAMYPNLPGALLVYSDHAFRLAYPDFSRDSNAHAEGGYQSNRFADAVAELQATAWDRLPDAALICYGTNDRDGGVTQATYLANMVSGVAALQAAGIFPIVLTIPAGDATLISGTPRSTITEAFNDALVAQFGGRNDVKIVDSRSVLEQSAGLANAFYSVDGIHLCANAQRIWAKDIIADFSSWGLLGPRRNQFTGMQPVNKNPFLKLGTSLGAVQALTGGTNTEVSRNLRADGLQYLGEKEVVINIDNGTPVIGTPATNAVSYAKKGGVTEAYVQHYANPAGNAVLSCEMRSDNCLRVNLVCAVGGGSITTTPAQIQSAVNAFGSSPYTATANGASAAVAGQSGYGQFWTTIEAGDEILSQGDQVRCVVEIKPTPGYDFHLRDFTVDCKGNGAGEGAALSGVYNTQNNHFHELYVPMNASGSLIIASPWATVQTVNSTTRMVTNPWVLLTYAGYGRFTFARLQIQKRVADPYVE